MKGQKMGPAGTKIDFGADRCIVTDQSQRELEGSSTPAARDHYQDTVKEFAEVSANQGLVQKSGANRSVDYGTDVLQIQMCETVRREEGVV